MANTNLLLFNQIFKNKETAVQMILMSDSKSQRYNLNLCLILDFLKINKFFIVVLHKWLEGICWRANEENWEN